MEKIAWKHDWVKKTEKNDWVNSWEEWLEKMSRKCDLEKGLGRMTKKNVWNMTGKNKWKVWLREITKKNNWENESDNHWEEWLWNYLRELPRASASRSFKGASNQCFSILKNWNLFN